MSQSISPELDELSCDLIAQALDALAAGVAVPVLVGYDTATTRDIRAFEDDAYSACLQAARSWIQQNREIVRYALLFDGDIADAAGVYQQALIIEFAERGCTTAYSCYVRYSGVGTQEDFCWAEPQPAGECSPL